MIMKNIPKKILFSFIVTTLILVTCVENHVLPSFGSIFITSDPIGAEIFLDGENTGKVTPDSLIELLSGSYTIQIKKQDFFDSTFVADVNENSNYNFNIIMKETKPQGEIVLTSEPSGAQIFLNDQNTGEKTPATFSNLERGKYNFRLSLELYDDFSFEINLAKDEKISRNVKLIIAGTAGGIFVTSNPSGANIILDDFDTGQITPDTLTPLAPGNYSLALSLENYRDTTIIVPVNAGIVTNANIDLTFYEPRGSIFLDSNPQGALIFLNNTNTGLLTPSVISKLEAGDYLIRLELENYFDTTFTVPVTEDERTSWPVINLIEVPNNITVTVNPAGAGTVTGAGGYNDGEQVTLEAIPAEGYNFVNWTENGSQISSNPIYTFIASSDRNIIANFELKTYTISASANPVGAALISGGGQFKHGEEVSLSFIANAGYRFVNWTENAQELSVENTLVFTANSDRDIMANFDEIGNLTVNSNPSNADIYLNNIFTGEKTPQTFVDLNIGSYSVTLKLEYFADTTIIAEVFTNVTTDLGIIQLRDITPDVNVEVTYFVNQNQQLIFTFTFNQDVRFDRVDIRTPQNNNFTQNYGGVLLFEGNGISWTYPEKVIGDWEFRFRGSKVNGLGAGFDVTKTVNVQ